VSAERTPAVTFALVAGLLGAVQPKINAVLGSRVGSALLASLVNFGVALVAVLVALAVQPATRRRLRRIGTWPVPRWTFAAGLGGALVVLAGAVAVETIGVAVFSIAFFAGQISFSLLVDRLGVAPGGKRPITATRIQAVVLAVIAVVLAQVGREAGDLEPALVVLVVAAGAGVAVQSAFNGRITTATADPVAATALNVAVGTIALTLVAVPLAGSGELESSGWPGEPWLYAGGALGVAIVLSLAVASAAIGVLRTTLAMLAAQLIAAFAVDWVIDGEPPTVGVIAGSVLIVVAVLRIEAANRVTMAAAADADSRAAV
jgi:bacterial/archaeal transporter family-2 protein